MRIYNTGMIRKRRLIKFTAFLLMISLLITYRLPAWAEDLGPDIFGETYCVIDGNTGEVLISHGKDEKRFPASTTKVMTALLTLENIDDLDQKVTFTRTAVAVDPSSSTLNPKAEVGEVMTVKDILYGMLLVSGNECGAMLGEVVAGSEKAFTEMMNRRAEELGAVNTHFKNAYGFHDPDHYSTAYDLCLILKAAMENERFREIMDRKEYTIPKTKLHDARKLKNTHAFLNGSIPEPGVIGGKTGSTPQAGRCLLTAAEQNGLYAISSVMKSDLDNVYADTSVILEYARLKVNGTLSHISFEDRDDEVYARDRVRIRYSPSLKGGTAGVLAPGESLHRTGIYNGWSAVEYKDRICYMSTSLLKDAEGQPLESTYSETAESVTTESPATEESSSGTAEEPSRGEPSGETAEASSRRAEETLSEENSPEEDTAAEPEITEGPEAEPSSEEKGFIEKAKEFFMDYLDLILTLLAALTGLVFIILWVLLFMRHRKFRKKRNETEKKN